MAINTNKKKNITNLALIFFIIFNIFIQFPEPGFGQSVNAVDLYVRAFSDKGEILKGTKDIDYDISYINLLFDTDFKIKEADLAKIEIIQNGRPVSLNKENYKFYVDGTNGVIAITLKHGPPDKTHMHPFRLRPHTLYNIYIPEGILQNNEGKYNKAIYHTFVTKAEPGNTYANDILKRTKPAHNDIEINFQEGKIEFEFVDDVKLVDDFEKNKGQYLEIISEPMDPGIPSYNMPPTYQYTENIDSFDVYTSGNKLVLKHKNGALKDFAKYTIRLKDESLFLKNSEFSTGPNSKIFNAAERGDMSYEEIVFYTDNMLEETYPRNNAENVEVESTIEFRFKYPVEFIDIIENGIKKLGKNKVKISSDGREFVLDEGDIYLSTRPGTNDTVLVLNVNDHEPNKIFPLRRHTVYKVTIEKGAIRFKDYWDTINNESISNKEINLYFITRGEGEFPVPIAYTSADKYGKDNKDDIRYLNHDDKEIIMPEDKVTELSTDGSILIHFDRDIQADKQANIELDKEGGQSLLLGLTRLYKLPNAYTIKYDSKGEVYDEKVIYKLYNFDNKGKKIFPRDERANMNNIINNITVNDNIYDIDKFRILEDLGSLDVFIGKTDPLFMDEVLVGNVEIINGNILKVTPKYELEALNKYALWIDKRAIEDKNRYNMEHNLKLTFWTKTDNKNTVAKWLKPEDTRAENIKNPEKIEDINNSDEIENIKEDSHAPYKSYTLYGVPQYGPGVPIVLDLDKEVIPRAQDDILEQIPNDARNTRRISYDALKEIELIDVYPTEVSIEQAKNTKKEAYKEEAKQITRQEAIDKAREEAIKNEEEFSEFDFDDNKFDEDFEEIYDDLFEKLWEEKFLEEEKANIEKELEIDQYEFFYYFEDGVKKTKIYLYPNKKLQRGKYYRLEVPKDTLQTRSANDVDVLCVDFVVEGKWDSDDKGVYFAVNNQVKVTDIWSEREHVFKIFGHNFHEKVEKVELVPLEGRVTETSQGEPVVIERKDIEFRSVTELWIKIRGENARKLSTEPYTGSYKINLYFKKTDGTLKELEGEFDLKFYVVSKGHPKILHKEPEGNADKWFNEHNLSLEINPKIINGIKRYFLKVTFEDIDGELIFNDTNGITNLLGSAILSSNSTVNYLDTDFLQQVLSNPSLMEHIFNKDRIKREAYLYIPVELLDPQATYQVIIPEGVVANDAAESERYNESIQWSFTTKAVPSVTEDDIIIQSVIENYNSDVPLIIYGDLFYAPTVEVYFNDIRADYVRLVETEDGERYLEVYLPSGRDRLRTGLYNIIVQNSENHQVETLGTLSVVPRGGHIPQEGIRIKESNRREEVVEIVARSEDTLTLNRYGTDRSIELDLDELMGNDTLVRKIQFLDGSSIRELSTYSKWANVDIYNIRVLGGRREENTVYVGRTEAFLADNLKRNLQNYNIKSDIIQVIGDNVVFESIYMEIPYTTGNENNFKVLRYDQALRSWTEEGFYINNIDKKVIVTSYNPGMFVVVEPKY